MKRGDKCSFWYALPGFGEIEFPPFVLAHFEKHQQKRKWQKEAGGQLFWEYTFNNQKRVGVITGPRPTDRRTRTSYKADPVQEQKEIDDYYDNKLYLLGDWHTHPEPIPSSSGDDREAIKEIYNSSINPGPGLVLAIVGTRPLYDSLLVSWCNGNLQTVQKLHR